MTCRDIDKCKNCPIKQLCDEVDDYCDDGRIDHELLAKIYTRGMEDALGAIEHSRVFASKVEIMNGEAYIPINLVLEVIDTLKSGKDINVTAKKEGEQNEM